MVKITILYGKPVDHEAFERHYNDVHLPLAGRIEGIKRIEAATALGTPTGDAPPYHRIVELYFDDMNALQTVMSTPAAAAVNADMPHFATGGVTVFVSQID